MANKQLTKYDKDRIKSRASALWVEMREALGKETLDAVGRDDTVRRVISMNCTYHGLNEKQLRAMPDALQVECKTARIVGPNRLGLLTVPLRRPVKVPMLLILANVKQGEMRHDSAIHQMVNKDGIVTEVPLLLPDPAGEMIGPAFGTMLSCMREQSMIQSDAARFQRLLRDVMDSSKSLIALCSVFPVLKHFITSEQEAELPLDLTKARGDVHRIARGVDMGQMIELSMKINAYMARRVVKEG